jgi:membrane protein insertase Oxa1/YidC/SpoIIIJ
MPDMAKMMPMMNIMMVFMMWSFVYSVKSGVWLYIVTSTLFGVIQFMRQYRLVLPMKLKALFTKKKE